MAATYQVYPFGSKTIAIGTSESIAVYVVGDNAAEVYQDVGYPNIPSAWRLIGTVQNVETIYGPFTNGASVRIDAGANAAFYNVGASPQVALPVSDITAGETPFDVTGLAAAQGGIINVTGGTSSTSANAGGAVNLKGGTPGATGIGGTANVVGGIGGATSGAGGAATVSGGAATAAATVGGAVTLTGGLSTTSAAGGAVNIVGGTAGSTGVGVRSTSLAARQSPGPAVRWSSRARRVSAQTKPAVFRRLPVGPVRALRPVVWPLSLAVPQALQQALVVALSSPAASVIPRAQADRSSYRPRLAVMMQLVGSSPLRLGQQAAGLE